MNDPAMNAAVQTTDSTAQASPAAQSGLLGQIHYNAEGLVCAVAQQYDTREVLMVAWMDDAALRATLTTGRATYFSRSRQQQWVKGETSGHAQRVIEARYDCDGDTVLLLVDQTGAACHTGSRTCFDGRVLHA